MKLRQLLATLFISVAVSLVVVTLMLPRVTAPAVGSDAYLTVGTLPYKVAGSGITATATSIPLTSFTIQQTGQKLTMANFGGSVLYGTIESGSTARQEFVSCTGVTQNSNGSATLTGCSRGLAPITPYTASTTLAFPHSASASFVLSNPPQLYNKATFKDNDESVVGLWDFSSTTPPRYDLVPANHNSGAIVATTSEFASVKFVQQVAASGCLDAAEGNQGCVELATQIEMASSTENGSDAKLVLQSKYATSSPYTTGLWTVITRNSGKIAQAFLDLTEAFTWSGANIFSGAVTHNATTTIAASSTVANALVLNGVAYRFPGSNGASSTALLTNGAGGLSWGPNTDTIANSATPAVTTTAATTSVATVIIPANALGAAARSLEFRGIFEGSAGSDCSSEVKYGDGTSTSTIAIMYNSNNGALGYVDGVMYATTTTAQAFSTRAYGHQLNNSNNFLDQVVKQAGIYTNRSLTAATYLSFEIYSTGSASCKLIGHTAKIITL